MDAKQFVQIESKSLMQEEVNRMMREVLENYTKSKQKYQKENQEKKNSFSFPAGQVKGGPPANAHKKHRPFV